MVLLKEFCYKLIRFNRTNFNNFCESSGIPTKENRYSLYTKNLERYKRYVKCNSKLIDFYITILNEMKMFECPDFLTALNENLNHIIELHSAGWELNLILTEEPLKKSNVYYSLLFLKMLLTRGIEVNQIYFTTSDFLDHNLSNGKKTIGILCDDVSYSGTQLAEHINDKISLTNIRLASRGDTRYKLRLNADTKIFFNLVAFLPKAQNTVFGQFISDDNYIVGRGTTLITESDDFHKARKVFSKILSIDESLSNSGFFREFKKKMNLYHSYYFNPDTLTFKKIDVLGLIHTKEFLQLSFVILFQKYPDVVSTYPNLCKMNRIIGNSIILDIDKLFELTGITEDEFLTKVQDRNSFSIHHLLEDKTDFTDKKWVDQITENKDNERLLLLNVDFLKKCVSSTKKQNLEMKIKVLNKNSIRENKKIIPTLKGEYLEGSYVKDENYCEVKGVQPFYKKLVYHYESDFLDANFTMNTLLSHVNPESSRVYFDDPLDLTPPSSPSPFITYEEGFENKYYKKYLKYKSKYLALRARL